MSAPPVEQLSGLPGLLKSLRRRVWVSSAARGVADLTAIVLACVLLAAVLDFLLPLPSAVRLILLLVVLSAAAVAGWRRLLQPLLSRVPDDELAAAVDLSFPDLQESLATLLSVEPGRTPSGDPGSAVMRRHLVESVTGRLQSVQSDRVVSQRSTWRRVGVAGSVLVLALVPVLMWPAASRDLLQRLLVPFANTGTVSNLYFDVPDADRVVAIGSDVSFTAIPHWRTGEGHEIPTDVVVQLRAQSGLRDELTASWNELSSEFVAVLPDIRQSLDYRIRGGGTETRWFTLQAEEAPRIVGAVLEATPPAYTGRAVDVHDGIVGDTTVFERSELVFSVFFSKPVTDITMVQHDWQPISTERVVDELPDLPPVGTAADGEPSHVVGPFAVSEDGRAAEFRFPALGSGRFEFRATDEWGLTNPAEPERVLIVEEDQPPQLRVSGIQDGLALRPDDVLPLDCRVADDIGVDALELYFRRNDEAERIRPANGFERGGRSVDWSFRLKLDEFDVTDGDTVTVRVRAADERPVPEPNVVWQGPWTVRIDDAAEAIGKQPLDNDTQRMLDELRQLEEALRQDASDVRELKNRVWKNWDAAARDQVGQLSEKEQQQGRQLQRAADQVAQHPLMQDQAGQVRDVGQRVAEQIPEPLDAAQESERGDAAEQLQEAARELDRSVQDLRKAIDEIETIARVEQELAELNRLALEAEQLADTADQLQQQRESGVPEAGQSPDEFQEQLQQQGEQLESDRQQLQQDLDGLLQRQQELLESARRAQQEQLADIADRARQLAEQERRIADGVNEEARDASRDTRTLADQLQQIRSETQQLARDTRQQAPDVQPPDARPLDDAIRELRRGNLSQPHEQIADVQQQLGQAGEQLQSPPQDGDPESSEQRAPLARRANDLAERLDDVRRNLAADASRRLGESPPQSPQPSPPQSPPQAAADPETSRQSLPDGGDSAESNPEGSQPDVARDLVERLQELAQSGEELADAVRQDGDAGRDAAGPARDMAREGQEAAEAAAAGQFSRAADRMHSAAGSAGEASERLGNEAQPDRPQQLQNLGDEYSQLADTVRQLQNDDTARLGAQQRTQRSLADQAADLPDQLADVSERLQLPALGMPQQARLADEARQAAAEAGESGQQASRQLGDGQLQQASDTARKTSGQLNRVAQLAQQAGGRNRQAPPLIPSHVGQDVAQAMQNLQRAGQPGDGQPGEGQPGSGQSAEAQTAGNESPSGQPAPSGSPGAAGQASDPGAQSQASSQDGSGQSGGQTEGSGAPGQPSSGGSGQPTPSSQLSDAARALAEAARNSLPRQFTPGQLPAGDPAEGQSAMGNDAEFDGRNAARSQFSGTFRHWGQLQDALDGELRNTGREIIDSEYSELIRRYRRELARAVADKSESSD